MRALSPSYELLVVISIIALLIAVLLPSLAQARKTATTIQCLSNQRGMFFACFQFAGDHKNWYPPNGNGVNIGSPGNTQQIWFTSYLDSASRSATGGGTGGEYLRADPHVGGVAGKVNPAVRCPELSAVIVSTGMALPVSESNTDYALSLLTGQPVDSTISPPNGNLSHENPWAYDVKDKNYWKWARNCVNFPGALQQGLGNYGPYRTDEVPGRIVFLADASLELDGVGLQINPIFLWYTQSGGYPTSGPSLAGSLSFLPWTGYYGVDPGTAPGGVNNTGVQFPVHFKGFNAMLWDGSGKTVSYANLGVLPFGSYSGTPSQYYFGAGIYQNATAWCPQGTAGDPSRGNARYGYNTGL